MWCNAHAKKHELEAQPFCDYVYAPTVELSLYFEENLRLPVTGAEITPFEALKEGLTNQTARLTGFAVDVRRAADGTSLLFDPLRRFRDLAPHGG